MTAPIDLVRVEHRRPDGPVRELLQTTMLTTAIVDAYGG